ncbi:unnamed protein product [Rotaria sp. Silwood1]|nr:unnamed protein product [Rotaria sp. Silwood1]CAF1360597.1 unnamed protein product [Rotaria sp. Silwood1]CAF1366693.1 unnamed protein product [Rotaria sp. Silwood1]
MCRCYSRDFKRSTSSSPPSYAVAPETITYAAMILLLQSPQLTDAQFRDLSVIVLQKAAEKQASATSALDRPPTPSARPLSELSSTASLAPSPS